MIKKATIEELISIKTRVENVAFLGQESFNRLKCMNRLAHFAIYGSIFQFQKSIENTFGPSQVYFLDHFIFNESFLNSIEGAEAENQETGFRKVQKRLVEDIKFFTDATKLAFSQPQQVEVHQIRRPYPQLLSPTFKSTAK